jgi:hypothetical protein
LPVPAEAMLKTQDDRLRWENVSLVVEAWFEQHAPTAFPYTIFSNYLEMELGVPGSYLYPLYLDDGQEFEFHAILDMVVQDAGTGNLIVVDHKTTGWLNALWTRQWGRSSQLTGYIWTAKQLLPNHQVLGAVVNAIELPQLPTSDKKCKTHGVPYAQCGKYHAKSELIGPLVRTPYEIEKWRTSAIGLARKLKGLMGVPLTEIHDLPMEGMFNGGCNAYGGCEFLKFCKAGRKIELVGSLLVNRQ